MCMTAQGCRSDCCNSNTVYGDANLNLVDDLVFALAEGENRIRTLLPANAFSEKRTKALRQLQAALDEVHEALSWVEDSI